MMPDVAHDARADSLSGLTVLTPDVDRAERVRTACRALLDRRHRRRARMAALAGFSWQVLAPAVVGAFCVLYTAMLVAMTLRFEGLFD
jgi:hypothetical protein